MLRRKVVSLSNLSLFKSETIISRKIISERKICHCDAPGLSDHLWFNGQQKSLVAGLK